MLELLVTIGGIAIVSYALIWFLYKSIIRPDIKKLMNEQELRNEDNKEFQRAVFDEIREIKEILKENEPKKNKNIIKK